MPPIYMDSSAAGGREVSEDTDWEQQDLLTLESGGLLPWVALARGGAEAALWCLLSRLLRCSFVELWN